MKRLYCLCLAAGLLAHRTALAQASYPVDTVTGSFRLQRPLSEYVQFLGDNFRYQARAVLHCKPTRGTLLAVTALGAAILQEDRRLNRELTLAKSQYALVRESSPVITTLGGLHGVLLLGGVGVYSGLAHDHQLATTVILASQSYITSGVWAMVLKTALGRSRPDQYNHWTGPGRILRPADRYLPDCDEFNSFPSGHTTTAFSIATVFARRYRGNLAAGITSYTLAGLVGLSRMTENRHWGSDILAGGILGYLCGTAVVKNYDRWLSHSRGKQSAAMNRLERLTIFPLGNGLQVNYAL